MAGSNSKPGRRSRKFYLMVRTIHAPSLYEELGLYRLGPLPWLNLYGDWLKEFGFERGRKVTVRAGWQRLVITVDQE